MEIVFAVVGFVLGVVFSGYIKSWFTALRDKLLDNIK